MINLWAYKQVPTTERLKRKETKLNKKRMSYDGLTAWTYSTERDQVPLNFSWHLALQHLCFSGRSTESDSLIPVLKEGGLSDFHWRRMRFWPVHKARAVVLDLETAMTSGCIYSKFVIWIVTAMRCFKLSQTSCRTNGGSVDAFQAESPELPSDFNIPVSLPRQILFCPKPKWTGILDHAM